MRLRHRIPGLISHLPPGTPLRFRGRRRRLTLNPGHQPTQLSDLSRRISRPLSRLRRRRAVSIGGLLARLSRNTRL
jgi:hypothetical protein